MIPNNIQQELMQKWGDRTATVLRELNLLISETLVARDLLGFSFITEATGRLMASAVEIAKAVQEQDHEHQGMVQ